MKISCVSKKSIFLPPKLTSTLTTPRQTVPVFAAGYTHINPRPISHGRFSAGLQKLLHQQIGNPQSKIPKMIDFQIFIFFWIIFCQKLQIFCQKAQILGRKTSKFFPHPVPPFFKFYEKSMLPCLEGYIQRRFSKTLFRIGNDSKKFTAFWKQFLNHTKTSKIRATKNFLNQKYIWKLLTPSPKLSRHWKVYVDVLTQQVSSLEFRETKGRYTGFWNLTHHWIVASNNKNITSQAASLPQVNTTEDFFLSRIFTIGALIVKKLQMMLSLRVFVPCLFSRKSAILSKNYFELSKNKRQFSTVCLGGSFGGGGAFVG